MLAKYCKTLILLHKINEKVPPKVLGICCSESSRSRESPRPNSFWWEEVMTIVHDTSVLGLTRLSVTQKEEVFTKRSDQSL